MKANHKTSLYGPISKKVIAGLKKTMNRKVIDFSELKNTKIHAENLGKKVISEKELADYDPLHGIYIYAHNKISILIEQIANLPAVSRLTNAFTDEEDLHLPSGPPMSPLTTSYFSCWGYFDLCVGLKKESFGTVIINLCRALNVDQGLIRLFEHMQDSRMGFYVHEGSSGRHVLLRELITQKEIKVIVPSGYSGKHGEIWFVRIMPEPFPELNYGYSVVFTTPYILLEMHDNKFFYATERNWMEYFNRTIQKTGIDERRSSYEILMKNGLNKGYWNEYIFEGYVNHTHDMILLAGFPDISLSKPHSKENENRRLNEQ